MGRPTRVRLVTRHPYPPRLRVDREAVVRLLGAGPVLGLDAGERAAAMLGWTLDRWWAAVDGCPWVTCLAWGPSGWRLTEAGRLVLAKLGGGVA